MDARRPPRRGTVIAVLVTVAIAFPAGALAIIPFTDVPPENPFYTDIHALAGSGVTTGCGDGKYCPKDFVTREQMAAFMNRLGALSAEKTPVVNADRLDGWHAADFVRALNPTIVTLSGGWRQLLPSHPLEFTNYSNNTSVKRTATGGSWIGLAPSLPVGQYGRAMRLTAVELCYDADANVILDTLEVVAQVQTTSTATFSQLLVDATDRTDQACRRYNLSTPFVLGPTTAVQVFTYWNWTTANLNAIIGRTTFYLEATATAVASSDAIVTKGTTPSDTSGAAAP